MTNRTMYWGAFILLVAATCFSGCRAYKTVATVTIDKSNKFVVTKAESAREDELPAVVETGDGQTLQFDKKQRVKIEVRDQEFAVDESGVSGSKETKIVTKTINYVGPGTMSLDLESQLLTEDRRGRRADYLSDDLVQITVKKKLPRPYKLTTGILLTLTGGAAVATSIAGFAPALDGDNGLIPAALVFVGISLPFFGVGIPLWVSGKRDVADAYDFDYRYSRAMMSLGIGLTVIGTLGLASAFVLEDLWFMIGGPSLTFIVPGILLWAVNSRRMKRARETPVENRELFDDRATNREKRNWGISLTVIGIVSGTVSAVFSALTPRDRASWPILLSPITVPTLAVGIPMWVINKRRMEQEGQNSAALPEPTVMFSPETNTYGLGLRWRL